MPLLGDQILQKLYDKWCLQESFFTVKVEGIELRNHLNFVSPKASRTEMEDRALKNMPDPTFFHCAVFAMGYIELVADKELSEDSSLILTRFAKVFEQAYTRFLDLQKAKEQAREAQIEASLERVRTKAMAMHSSEDLTETVGQLFVELDALDFNLLRCGVGRIHDDKQIDLVTYRTTKKGVPVPAVGNMLLSGHPVLDGCFQAWQKQEEHHAVLKGASLEKYYEVIQPDFKFQDQQKGEIQYGYYFTFSAGALYTIAETEFSEEELSVFRKFASVVGLTYRRFLDLIAAEKRAGDAIKDSSLDRVRAEIASMRNTTDLERITPLVWKELTTLGVPFFRCGVFIIEENSESIHMYLTSPTGESLAALHLGFDDNDIPLVTDAIEHWKSQTVHRAHWNQEDFKGFSKSLQDRGLIQNLKTYQQGEKPPENLYLHQVPFKQGMMYVGSSESLPDEQIELVQSLANAFSVAYSRYEDFVQLEEAKESVENTLTDLKSAQNQLVHSEKMASFGELTAGIAHEIQNPLNFVNNFSEINKELIEELKEELAKGDIEEVNAIAQDIIDNEEKVMHHGKRAEGIVKSMLAHSRTSTNTKEPTDINALADEYLRLAFHGLRAKDKSFNADFKADLAADLPKITVVPQDIGRVLLNLINNAFQATSAEASAKAGSAHKPLVMVSTKKLDDKIEITVSDNGPGIPDDIKDKIFEPFFTTKPTGEGTGLGLSMSYDIVTKGHGGELKVETKEGEGTEFIVELPVDS